MNVFSRVVVLGSIVGMVAPAAAGKKSDWKWTQTWTSDSDHTDFAYALVEPSENGGELSLNGTEDDRDGLLRLRDRTDGPFVWMRQRSQRYLIQDAGMIARAREILAPELEISRDAGSLGELQGRLGTTQSRVGIEQARLGEWQARLGERQARLAEERIRAGSNAARQRALDEQAQAIDEESQELSRAQTRLGETQSRMGEKQSRLGEEQSRDQEARRAIYVRVRNDMRRLLDEAITRKAARRI